jgi:F-type H+-transporting ATPase subunit delta
LKRHPRALARRYARALYEVAVAQGADQAQRLGGELADLSALIQGSPKLSATLSDPALPAEARGRVLRAVVEKTGGSPLLGRLVALLASRERIGILGALVEAYGQELGAAQGVVAATAVSAVPLDDSQRDALTRALGASAGKRVELTSQVDPAVLGGLLVRMGGQNYDGTVRGQLLALRRRLAAGN